MSQKTQTVTVKIVSDIIWPWCYVAQKNLYLATSSLGLNVTIEWIPFFLNKNTPAEGVDLAEYIDSKYGKGVAASAASRLDLAGRQVGIKFNGARRVVNTTSSHRLMEYVNSKMGYESGDKIMQKLFHAYFEDAKDVSKHDVLLDCVDSLGIDKDEVRRFLQSKDLNKEIDDIDQKNKSQRINGVPLFVFQKKSGEIVGSLSGAQPPDVLKEILVEALDE